jgi:polyisoprenoid-binding protein YceI
MKVQVIIQKRFIKNSRLIRNQVAEISTGYWNTGKLFRLAVLGIMLLALLSGMKAQSNFTLKSVRATIQGTSSLHDWESDITKIMFQGSLHSEGKDLKTIKGVEVKVPVQGIKSKEGRIMDNKTYDAFKSEKHPFIIYSFNLAQAKTDNNNSVSIETTGNLTMAGTTKPVALTAKGKVLGNGDLQLMISKKLKMTDFKMVPPTAMMGAIKVGDEVTVNFNLVLSPQN